ncbi:maleylacetoacetate isomerase [Sporothrix schenckii 1099-18]|uniref:Maleylacetoacetate isomerase n=2 Tax=Sporothrix schenckii TaxID=29908 RepID=U7PJ20_SPOS1|nr:maleylacetoacetate isomerase [Sporothrix schenckii 1099-18]ERS95643.1 maleylacetoacetate isomerase [Sporothrix schenckii ATCC 58251]KJR83655.1 maleylacetoacetate isomerase [Sporothrix schenckii 1099-18]
MTKDDFTGVELTLYTYFRSSCSARVRTAAALKGLAVTPHYVNLLKEEQSAPTYTSNVNPCGTVPSLVAGFPDGSQATIRQSVAILEFFEEAFPDKRPLLPGVERPLQRAVVRDIVSIITGDVQPKTNSSVLHRMRTLGIESADWCKEIMVPGIRAVEAILQTSAGKHSVGDDITLADVVIAPAYEAALRWGVDLTQFEAVTHAYNACKDLPEFVAADWKHQADTPEQFRAV